jgi:hypothetical protein
VAWRLEWVNSEVDRLWPDGERGAFAASNGRPDPTKVLQFSALVQQAAEKQLGTNAVSRLALKVAANPSESFKSAHKAFAKFRAQPLLEVNLTKPPDGFKLKAVKVGGLFKQFKVVKRKS